MPLTKESTQQKPNALVALAQQLAGIQAEAKPANKNDDWKQHNVFIGDTFLFQTRSTTAGTPAVIEFLEGLKTIGVITSYSADKKEAVVMDPTSIQSMFSKFAPQA